MMGFREGSSVAAIHYNSPAYVTYRKSSFETTADSAAKGHREHRLVSETELGRKSFNSEWDISSEL